MITGQRTFLIKGPPTHRERRTDLCVGRNNAAKSVEKLLPWRYPVGLLANRVGGQEACCDVSVRIDPDSYVPAYHQIADDLRQRIENGRLAPGQKLPPEARLAYEYGVGKDALRDALAQLRGEGLIRTVSRDGSYIRDQVDPVSVPLHGPARIRTRMPTPEERRRLHLGEGIPVLIVDVDGDCRILAGHTTEIEIL